MSLESWAEWLSAKAGDLGCSLGEKPLGMSNVQGCVSYSKCMRPQSGGLRIGSCPEEQYTGFTFPAVRSKWPLAPRGQVVPESAQPSEAFPPSRWLHSAASLLPSRVHPGGRISPIGNLLCVWTWVSLSPDPTSRTPLVRIEYMCL